MDTRDEKGIRVSVADDRPENVTVLRSFLAPRGFDAGTAAIGEEASRIQARFSDETTPAPRQRVNASAEELATEQAVTVAQHTWHG